MAWDTGSKLNRLFRRSRWQLTGWYTGVMAIVLAISALGMYEAIAHAHRVAADRELKSVAEAVHDNLEKSLTSGNQIESGSSDLLPSLCLTGDPCLAPFEHSQNHYHPDDLYSGNYYIRVLGTNGALVATAGDYPQDYPALMFLPSGKPCAMGRLNPTARLFCPCMPSMINN